MVFKMTLCQTINAHLLKVFLKIHILIFIGTSVELFMVLAQQQIQAQAQAQQPQPQQQQQQHQHLHQQQDVVPSLLPIKTTIGSSESQQTVLNWQATTRPNTSDLRIVGAGIVSYLLAEATNEKLNQSSELDSMLSNILNRNGPDMRPLRDFRDFDDISLDIAKRAWQLMHDHAEVALKDRFSLIGPLVNQALKAANVSEQCVQAAQQTMEAAQRLDSWAIQLLTAWGNFPPTGMFEGTLGDVGSFHGCVNVPQNPIINHAHYCTIAYRPVMPTRKNFEIIVTKEPNELLNLFKRFDNKINHSVETSTTVTNINENRVNNKAIYQASGDEMIVKDAFTDILNRAQYNHYVYYKFGTCFPIKCSPRDVQKLAKLLGKRSILMSGPVKCHSKYKKDYEEEELVKIKYPHGLKNASEINNTTTTSPLKISTRDLNDGLYIWKPHMTLTQWVSLIIISLITLIIISMTLIDIIINIIPKYYKLINIKQQIETLSKQDNIASLKKSDSAIFRLDSLREFNPPKSNDLVDNICDAQVNNYDTNNNNNNNTNKSVRDQTRSSNGLMSMSKIETNKISNNKNGDACENGDTFKSIPLDDNDKIESNSQGLKTDKEQRDEVIQKRQIYQMKNGKNNLQKNEKSLFMDIVDDYSIVTNVKQFFRVSQNQLKNDILCINGIRCITMSWIILTHTMQYNDWSAFARIYEVETHLKSLINQPLFNGSYLVDTFFLVSGLLTSYSSFKNNTTAGIYNDNILAKFSIRSYLIGRYLRLTPQIMFVSMLFILLPQLSQSGGPHWYTMTGEYSENCSQNWWINIFHIQAFYRTSEMCNYVCWWISVDMFYHMFALVIILIISYYPETKRRSKAGSMTLLSCIILILSHGIIQAIKHYQLELPPNLLSTIPQTGAMWSKMTLEFFWTPYAHAFPFFLGFYIGYLMAQNYFKLTNWFNLKRSILGWILSISLIIIQSYSTYYWVIGKWQYTRLMSTIFYLICPIVWSTCLTWIILACQYGYGSWINQLLSCKLFIILGKASYIVYLSHFLVLFTFFGSQNLLLEPTQLVMLYVILGNICLSMLLGSLLCIVYEMPWLKTQKRLMRYIC